MLRFANLSRGGAVSRTSARAFLIQRASMSTKLGDWATIDPATWSGAKPYKVENLGAWKTLGLVEKPPVDDAGWIRVHNCRKAHIKPGNSRGYHVLNLYNYLVPRDLVLPLYVSPSQSVASGRVLPSTRPSSTP